MTSKNDLILKNGKKDPFLIKHFPPAQNDDRRFLNLNLNGNSKCSNVSSFVQFQSNLTAQKQFDFQRTISFWRLKCRCQKYYHGIVATSKVLATFDYAEKIFNKSSNNGLRSKTSDSFNFYNESEKEDETKKRWKKRDSTSSSIISESTLSLHIAAYENSVEADSDVIREDVEVLQRKQQSLGDENRKQACENLFEFPRQQENKAAEPEISQFKASQKLLNPNESSTNQNSSSSKADKADVNCLDVDSIELHRKRREVLQKFPYFFVAYVGNQGSGKAEVRRACFQQTSVTNKDTTLPLDAKSIVIHDHRIDLIAIKRVCEFASRATSCSYLNALIVFYNITNLEHFNSVHQKWIPAIKRLYPTTPFIICATGIEARENSVRRTNVSTQFKRILGNSESPLKTANLADDLFPMVAQKKNHYEKFVTKEMGESLAKEVGAASFIEVSTITFENIPKLMDLMFEVIMESETAKMSLHGNRIGRPRPDETCHVT